MKKHLKRDETWQLVAGIVILGLVAAVIVFILRTYPVTQYPVQQGVPTAPPIDGGTVFSRHIDELTPPVAAAYFECAAGKSFFARVEIQEEIDPENPGKAEVFLADGSKLLLVQTASAAGLRYENAGGSFVFTSTAGRAALEEGGQVIYADCFGRPAR